MGTTRPPLSALEVAEPHGNLTGKELGYKSKVSLASSSLPCHMHIPMVEMPGSSQLYNVSKAKNS